MSSDWTTYKLRDAGRIVTGKTPKGGNPLFEGDAVPFVTPYDFIGKKWISKTKRYISEAGARSIKSTRLPKNAVMVTCIGTDFGKVSIAKTGCVANQQINSIVVDGDRFSADFIYYTLVSMRPILRELAGGSAVPILNKSTFSDIGFSAPSPDSQQKIVDVLCGIDGEIEALQHQNTEMESIAQTLFRSWFVNFDPVRAKLAGNGPDAMSAELAALFPSEFEDNERGLIPKGWTAGRLNAICSLNPESWSTSRHPAILNYVDLSGLKENVVLASERYSWSDAPSRARRVLRKGDSLYGTVRPGNLSYGYIGENSDALTGSTGFAVLRPADAGSAEFVYCAMTLRENIERLTHLAEGAAYPAVRPDIVHEQELVLPSSECLKAFHRVVSPLFAQATVNSQLIKELGALRDHLLPRLISGKLRIEDAEASLAAITSELEAELA